MSTASTLSLSLSVSLPMKCKEWTTHLWDGFWSQLEFRFVSIGAHRCLIEGVHMSSHADKVNTSNKTTQLHLSASRSKSTFDHYFGQKKKISWARCQREENLDAMTCEQDNQAVVPQRRGICTSRFISSVSILFITLMTKWWMLSSETPTSRLSYFRVDQSRRLCKRSDQISIHLRVWTFLIIDCSSMLTFHTDLTLLYRWCDHS